MLLDPETWDSFRTSRRSGGRRRGQYAERIHPELMQSVLEITTPVRRTPAEPAWIGSCAPT